MAEPTKPATPIGADNEIQSAIAAGMVIADTRYIVPDGNGVPFVALPKDAKLAIPAMGEVEAWMKKPLRKTGSFEFADVESFSRYFNEHKTDESRIFASVRDHEAHITGELDFHGREPSFNTHRCWMHTRATHEWKVWLSSNKKHMNQMDFAQFLEEYAEMFTDPSGAALLELVQTLEGKSHVDFTSAVKLQTKAVKLTYSETVELKGGTSSQAGELTIPQILNVGIAPFEGTVRYAMKARLRYRIENRKLSFWYEAVDTHLVVRDVVSQMLEHIERLTGVQPFRV